MECMWGCKLGSGWDGLQGASRVIVVVVVVVVCAVEGYDAFCMLGPNSTTCRAPSLSHAMPSYIRALTINHRMAYG